MERVVRWFTTGTPEEYCPAPVARVWVLLHLGDVCHDVEV